MFGGRRKILGCLPEWRNSTEQTSPPVLALPLRQALTKGASRASVGKVEFGQTWLACLGDAQRVKVEAPPLQEGDFSFDIVCICVRERPGAFGMAG